MENIFKIKDKVVKVEHFRTVSKILSWNLNEKNVWVKDNLESIEFVLDFDQKKTISGLSIQ